MERGTTVLDFTVRVAVQASLPSYVGKVMTKKESSRLLLAC